MTDLKAGVENLAARAQLEQAKEETKERYEQLSEREKQVQASFWGQLFLIAELATGLRLLRDKLIQKELLTVEEDQQLSQETINPETLREAYRNTELAFHDKYQRIRFSMENPGAVEEELQKGKTNEEPAVKPEA
jgi:hypothetical protein